ncbi:21404_t:CDS:2 [Gigaspora rosea]|nr:21404_t:CDS:2 [Gigaspora rosea]
MSNPQQFQCRMYEAKYPEVDDLVMVNVRQIAEMGAYVKLLEYDNIEGMILLSELSRRRIRSIQKLIRVGRNEVVVVLRVDKEKGYIDLSKRRVSAEDQNLVLEDLYKQIGWPLYKKYGHAYEAFKLAIAEPEKIFEGLEISKEIHDELLNNIKRRLTPQPNKIRADIEVTCFGYDGIDAIRSALRAGEACETSDMSIKVKLVAPPLYVMITNALDKGLGIEMLEKAISTIQEAIEKSGGNLTVKMRPKAVSEADDRELAALMANAERDNAEVSGDEDSDAEAAETD